MIALQIKITKNIMNLLLASEYFDSFLVEEATITTFNTFNIDGHIVKDFFTDDELENMPTFSSWREVRPICFQLIKGKKTPAGFKLVLQASSELIDQLASSEDCEVARNLIKSLVLNIRYDGEKVTCITGSSFTTFIMDKSIDKLWDSYIRQFFSKLNLDYEEV